jgi:hypothetical protein
MEDIKEDPIEKAPPLIYLDDDEKFIDNKGNIIEIEVRGQREYDQCYFKVKDIMNGFDIKTLYRIIIDKRWKGFSIDVHYKYFYSEKIGEHEKGKKKNLFLTYKGLLRVLFASHKKTADKFVDWATKVLFTAQLGTYHQKNQLVSNLLGVSVDAVKEVFNKNAHKMPCIYLFSIGRVKDLRQELAIDDSYSNKDYVYKWGRTRDLERRTKEHQKKYGSIDGCQLELVSFGFIDPQYVSEAETKLQHLFNDMDMILECDGHKELAVISKKKIRAVKEQYETIAKAYLGHTSELIQQIKEKDHQLKEKDNVIKIMKKQHENELLIEKHCCQILEKELEIANLKLAVK